jgi:hypothetical protein
LWATARNRKQNKTREFVVWARGCNTKPELNDFPGTGVCKIIAHLYFMFFKTFPPSPPPDPKLKNISRGPFELWAFISQTLALRLAGQLFNFGSGGKGGNHHNLLRWAIISQTPVPRKSRASDLPSQTGAQNIFHGDLAWRQHSTQLPRKSFSSGLVLQSRAQTTNSRVLFCFRFRAAARNEGPPSAGPSEQRKA